MQVCMAVLCDFSKYKLLQLITIILSNQSVFFYIFFTLEEWGILL